MLVLYLGVIIQRLVEPDIQLLCYLPSYQLPLFWTKKAHLF